MTLPIARAGGVAAGTPASVAPLDAFVCVGPDLMTGAPSTVILTRGAAGSGRRLIGSGVVRRLGARAAMPGDRIPGAGFAKAGDFRLVEHLLAAALVWGVRDFECRLPQGCVPLLDGSARTWSRAFQRLNISRAAIGAPEATGAAWSALEGFRFSSRSARGGTLEARAEERFIAEVSWTRGPDGPETFSLDQGSRRFSSDLSACLDARTFVDAETFCAMASAGWRDGADAMAGRLLRGAGRLGEQATALARSLGADPSDPVWTGGTERVANECAAHKMLDLLGDIAQSCATFPPLRIVARDAGHDLHLELARAIHARLHAALGPSHGPGRS